MHSTLYAGNDEASTVLQTNFTSPDDASTLDVVSSTESSTTRYVVTTTKNNVTSENVTITSEGYTSTLGKIVWLCLTQ
jgi:hypothetical protein